MSEGGGGGLGVVAISATRSYELLLFEPSKRAHAPDEPVCREVFS